MLNFIVLGLIPGTSLQITLTWLLGFVLFAVTVYTAMRYRAWLYAKLKSQLPIAMLSRLNQ